MHRRIRHHDGIGRDCTCSGRDWDGCTFGHPPRGGGRRWWCIGTIVSVAGIRSLVRWSMGDRTCGPMVARSSSIAIPQVDWQRRSWPWRRTSHRRRGTSVLHDPCDCWSGRCRHGGGTIRVGTVGTRWNVGSSPIPGTACVVQTHPSNGGTRTPKPVPHCNFFATAPSDERAPNAHGTSLHVFVGAVSKKEQIFF